MRRSIAVLLLLAVPALAADPFRDWERSFEGAFGAGGTAKERLAAAEEAARWDTDDCAETLVSGIGPSHELVERLRKRKRDVQQGMAPAPDGDVRAEMVRLKGEIDAELRVLGAIRETLMGFGNEETLEWLRRDGLSDADHWKGRQVVADVLGVRGGGEAVRPLTRALRDRDARVRIAAAVALGRIGETGALPHLAKLFRRGSWTVRAAAIEAIGTVGGKEAIDLLVERVGREEGRLQEDCAVWLERLTGRSFGTVASAWGAWWKDHREGFTGPPEKPEPKPDRPEEDDDTYYGIPVRTTSAIFIIDVSESMKYSATDWKAELPGPGDHSRLDSAKRELIHALHGFDPRGRFNVVAFHSDVFTWKRGMVVAKEEEKEAAKDWVRDLEPSSTTNIYGALEKAFEIAGMGTADKHYGLRADTIFLLSDGAPTNLDYTDDDPMRVIRAVRAWNPLKRVRIHTIGLKGHKASFMSRLAKENGGTYVSR